MKNLGELLEYVHDISDDRLQLSGISVTNMKTNVNWFLYLQDAHGNVFRGDGKTFEQAVFSAAMDWKNGIHSQKLHE